MPRVPTYDSFQATPNTLPQTRMTMPEMPDVAGQQAQQMGRAMMAGGQQIGQVALDMQQQANQLRVDDALNKAKEAALRLTYDKDVGFTNLRGINALERPDGKPLADEYSDTLKRSIDDIAGTLGNDAQRRAFALHSNDILTSFRGQAVQHEASEYKTYALSTSEGIQSTALRDIALNWNNPDAINSAVDRIKAETFRQAQLLGKSAEWQEAQARKLTSNAHKIALMSALEQNNPTYASAYLNKYSGQMDADDILTVRGHITKDMDGRAGLAAATDAVGKVPIQVSDGERAFNIAVGTESGGRQFGAHGKPLTSPKGAVGIAQVMPDTAPEAAKLAGLPWDENRYRNNAAYNRALGMAYFQKQLRDFGGDLPKAYAAYNAGPGALQSALKDAKDGNWLALLPKETQDYVVKNMQAYNAGQGRPARPTLADIEAQLQNDPRLAGNPERLKIARVEAERQFNMQTAALKQRDDEAVVTALRGLYENGGRFSELPVSIRANIPPEKLTSVMGAAERIAKGDDTTSLWLYNKLTNSPDELARMSDNEFYALRTSLSEADFKHFSQERAKRLGAAPSTNGPGDLNSQAIKAGLDTRLRMMGDDPTPKDGSSDAERVGAMRKFIDGYFIAAQREAGKKFTDAEVEQHLDALFMKNATVRGWFSNSSVPILSMKVGDIDSTTKDGIKAAYKRAGIDSPTDAQILNAYWNLKVSRK
ncbi:transglycosylase SLT domain-containing protein [Bordetella parapertussis]|uniref:Transglycosylase SLT domain-containing protein n=1 Tax=Bordetella parapertussis (strain Bpp5) TaxID=1208660 RepID=K0MGU5_BORPB|nr:transglycosylase SLT domain-containing protein [Bordetella parapertussis]CCJ48972.1 Hypothetical protein BN117_1639 [Bordetella parapertussis Bpp5]